MRAIIAATSSALVVGALLFVAMVLSSWTVLHSGWPTAMVRLFGVATYVFPPAVAAMAGWYLHRTLKKGSTEPAG
jgi:hypothetical protein